MDDVLTSTGTRPQHLSPFAPQPRRLSASELEPLRRTPSPGAPPRRPSPFQSPRRSPSPLELPPLRLTIRPRRRFIHLFLGLVIFCLLGIIYSVDQQRIHTWIPPPKAIANYNFRPWMKSKPRLAKASYGALRMQGQKSSFRTNLRTDQRYITAWYHGTWSDDVITAFNLIYLAKLTGRIPVLPAFSPDKNHESDDSSPDKDFTIFSHIFDLPRLAEELGIPIVEWHELKSMNPHTTKVYGLPDGLSEEPPEADVIGCWSTWLATCKDGCRNGRAAEATSAYMLDVHYTPIPPSFARQEALQPLYFDNLTDVALPQPNPFTSYYLHPSKELRDFTDDRQLPLANPQPDDQMACFDVLRDVSETGLEVLDEFSGRSKAGKWGGVWGAVGRYATWNPKLEDVAQSYLRRAFGIEEYGTPLPPFISIDVRREHLKKICPLDTPKCLPTIDDHADRIEQVIASLRQKTGIVPDFVLMVTDDTDPSFLHEVFRRGWMIIDHEIERTVERYGRWYPMLLDNVMLSMGTGFVGTSASTPSILTRRRVEDWNKGIGAFQPRYQGMGPDYDD